MGGSDYFSFQKNELIEALGLICPPVLVTAELAASIIIVNYNGWHDLERCLKSLETSQLTDCEVIVVDNSSTDDSPEQIERTFPYVRLIRSASNLGFGAGNNLGAQIAIGRVLVFLNPDTTVTPGWLSPLLTTVEADPQVGMATARILLMNDPDRVNTCGNELHLSGIAFCRGMGKPLASRSNDIRQVAAVSGAAFAIRRELFHQIGGFDEAFFLYMEDTDLSIRVQLAGYKCLFVPDSVVYHDYTLTFGQMKTYYQERNRYLMLIKSLHWPTLIVLLPALILSEVVTWGFVLLRDRSRIRNKLFAYVWVLFWWREIMQKRAQAQKQRRVSDRSLLHLTTAHLDFAQAGGNPLTARLAYWIFEPVFTALRWSALALVWW